MSCLFISPVFSYTYMSVFRSSTAIFIDQRQLLTQQIERKWFLIIIDHFNWNENWQIFSLTFPSRAMDGGRLSATQCAAVKMKYSEMTVPPQLKVTS